MRPRLNPPCSNGLVSRSPNVAPSGRVRINASQNSQVREIFVRKYATATSASAEDDRSPCVPQARAVGEKIAESRPEGVREKDGCPVERFSLARDDAIDRNRTKRETPQSENRQQTGNKASELPT